MTLSPAEQIAAQLKMRGLTLDDLRAEHPTEPTPDVSGRRLEVQNGPELRRILALPRRTPPAEAPVELQELAALLTTKLARSPKPYPGPLRPIQAAALREAWEVGGVFGPIRAGAGKTLLSYLLPVACGAQRPLYVCPAALREDVRREFKAFHSSWYGPHPDTYRIASYETLGGPASGVRLDERGQVLRKGKLDQWQPDLIVLDEAHKLKNAKAAVTRRVKRFIEAHPGVRVIAMSGTMTRKSIHDFAHIAKWALPRMCPVPTTHAELEAWADFLDEKEAFGPRCSVGALVQLGTTIEQRTMCGDDEEAARVAARQAVRRRINETPGVVATLDGPLGIPLRVDHMEPPREVPEVEETFKTVRALWELPNHRPIVDGLEMSRHTTSMGLGFWTHWDPPPPDEWLRARREWCSYAREVITHNRRGIDSEAQVKENVRKGLLKDYGALEAWEEWAPQYDPEQHAVAVWISDEVTEAVQAWLDGGARGIVWVAHIPLGQRLSQQLGIPYYAGGGLDSRGRFILDHPKGEPMIASAAANRTGRNLQRGWHEGLLLTAPDEQLLARTHRDGQEAERVVFTQYVGCAEHLASFWKAVRLAAYAEQTTGQAQRLVYADTAVPEWIARTGARWTR